MEIYSIQFSSVTQSCPTLCDPMNRPPCPSPTPRVYSRPLSWWCHLTILFHPLLLLPSISPNIMSQLFASGSQSIGVFSFNISPSNEHLGLISFRMDWLNLLGVQGTLKSLLQYHSSTYSFPFLEPVFCSMSISNYCFLNFIQISQEAGQVVW